MYTYSLSCNFPQFSYEFFRFATEQRNALLFYNGRYNEMHDFIALEVIDEQIQFSFSLGTSVTLIKASIVGGVSDGQWHTVTVDYLNRVSFGHF